MKKPYSTSSLRPLASEHGEVNILAVMVVFLLASTLILGGLAIYYIGQFNQAQTTVDQQVADAVADAKEAQKQADEVDFKQRQKKPYRQYNAPNVLGALSVSFPKNWNIYAEEDPDGSTQLNLYLNPEVVRAPDNFAGSYSLRLTLERTLYTDVIGELAQSIEDGLLVASPAKVSKITSTKYSGEVNEGKQGLMVVVPVRDKTLKIWTESNEYAGDFNEIIKRLRVSP